MTLVIAQIKVLMYSGLVIKVTREGRKASVTLYVCSSIYIATEL